MKTFAQLSVTDNIYRVGGADVPRPRIKHIVKMISLEEKYGKVTVYLDQDDSFIIQGEELNLSVFKYREQWYTTDESLIPDVYKKIALLKIEYNENEIAKHKKTIENLRMSYWEYLKS